MTQGGDLAARLTGLLDRWVADDPLIPGIALALSCPSRGLDWSSAAGLADPGRGTLLSPAHPVRLASVTKTFTAAATLCLWEEGRLHPDDPLTAHLAPDRLAALAAAGYQPAAITLRQLLGHTSGLFDFADAPAFIAIMEADPGRLWSRDEQLAAALAWGPPYGAPGEVYRYSDTGYLLLSEVLERATGEPYAAVLRSRLGFARLGLGSTWLESLEPAPPAVPPRAHQLYGERDTFDWSPTMDLWGGGGLVSTVGDLVRFFQALPTGEVFAHRATFTAMLTPCPAERAGPSAYGQSQEPGHYGLGLQLPTVGGRRLIQHGGYWGTLAAHVPDLDLTFALSINQERRRDRRPDLVAEILALLVTAG